MELPLSGWLTTVFLPTAILLCFSFFYSMSRKENSKNLKKKSPPVAAGGWPLIGHLPLLSGPKPLHITLSKMADEYGPIFCIRMGTRRALIVNSSETVQECIRSNDIAFSNRPKTAAIGLMGYNFAMLGFSDYGPYWREMRKISVLRLLSNRKVAMMRDVREIEVNALMKSMYEKKMVENNHLDMRKVFGDLTLSLMVRTVAGDVEEKMDSREREKWREAVREFFKMMTVFTVSDVFSFLKWFDMKFGGWHQAFVKTGKMFDAMLQVWLDEHKKVKASTTSCGDQGREADFMTEMLGLADSVAQEFPKYDADTINKATCQTMMVGGTETMSATLIWALSLVLNNPHTMRRAQEELDKHIGRERLVQESDLNNLVYIQAIIKETMRVQPPVPVIPREVGQDCIVSGYHIPAGTRVFVNLWKIHRDPSIWPDPLEFRPERFLTSHKDVDVQGLHFELIPFGGGRRVCPAIPFALRAMQLALASLLHGFDIETASGERVDMCGTFGTTNGKATPLEVVLSPRLSPEICVNILSKRLE